MNKEKLILFLDSLGRTIIGVEKEDQSNAVVIAISNPAVLNVMPKQNNTMQVQIIPLIFKEVMGNPDKDCIFYYKTIHTTLTNADFELNDRIISQYKQIFAPSPTPKAVKQQVTESTEGQITPIKLFDEESK